MIANWKMHKDHNECADFTHHFLSKYSARREAWIAPQSLHIQTLLHLFQNSLVKIGSQNCSDHLDGAYTGEISAKSLKSLGAEFVILGHSERRQIFKESSSFLNAKIRTALAQGLKVVYCVGELLEERESNQTYSIIENQINQALTDQSKITPANFIVAYEPVWAIGTGKVASPEQAQEVHSFIRTLLQKYFPENGEKIKILYGGSVKPNNVETLLSQKDIDGALVGGASLKAEEFLVLCDDK
jgi:triosephosphate isomerase